MAPQQVQPQVQAGIIPRAIEILSKEYAQYKGGLFRRNYELKVSFLEIYNDQVSDLLATFNPSSVKPQ